MSMDPLVHHVQEIELEVVALIKPGTDVKERGVHGGREIGKP